ncbi:hypothetical protein Tco_0638248 [Tanacetum coccineum]
MLSNFSTRFKFLQSTRIRPRWVPGKGDDDLSERNGQEKEEGALNKENDQNVQDFRAELDNFLVQQKEGFDNVDDQERIDSSTQDVNTVRPNDAQEIPDEFYRGAHFFLWMQEQQKEKASTPIETNKALLKDEEAEDMDVHLYRSMIGSLMYLTASRPDIMFAVCACASIHYSDYAGASLDRKSTTGGYQFLGKRLISWQCKKQTIVANSTTEAEYVAAANCCGKVLWIQNQMLDYGFNFMNTKIYINNESTICIVKNPVFHSKTKHIEIRHHFISDSYEKKLIQVIKIHTDHNVADLLTKSSRPIHFDAYETVYKEWEDRMERAATTASSLEAEQDSGAKIPYWDVQKLKLGLRLNLNKSNDPPLSRVNTLRSGDDNMKLMELMEHCTKLSELSEESEGFHQIIDFLTASHIKYALTENPTIYVSLKQFWQTATTSTLEDGDMGITAIIDGKVKVVFEASIRIHLKLEDSDGISTLSTAEIFKQFALMGFEKTAWEQFSSNIATAIICLATNRAFNFSNLIFEAMVKNLDSKTKFLMYPRFIQIFLNKHQRVLLPNKRTYLTPTLTQKLFSNMKRASKRYSGVNTPLFQTMLVQDQGEGPTIPFVSHHTPTSGPSTSQPPSTPPSIQTTPVTEEAAPMPHESPLPRVYSLGSDEGSLLLNELTYSLTKLIKRVKKLEQIIKTSQARRRAKVVISNAKEDKEDSSKQGRSLIEELDMDAGISLVPPHVSDQGAEQRRDVKNVQTYTRRRKAVRTASGGVSTSSELVSTAGVKEKDKVKAVLQESEPPKKIKKRVQEAKFKAQQEQERLNHETAMNIQEELDAAERQRMAQVHQAAQGFTDDEWDDILARVAADKDFVQQLQAGEKVSDEDLPRKLVELVNQRRKFFTQQRAEAKRNKLMTPTQQKEYMSTYIKNQEGGYTLKQLKALSFEEVKEIFEATMRKVQSFVPMDYKLEIQRRKRAGQDVIEEPAKRQRTGEASGSVQEQTSEEPKAEELVGGHTEAYQTFDDMLKKFNRDDLDKLWNLVKEIFRTTKSTEDKARELWWLYDTCGVHHVSTERGHDIYMLVEKDYPLTKALMTLMLCNKLRVDQYSDMAEELLKKIFILVERPRHYYCHKKVSTASTKLNTAGGVYEDELEDPSKQGRKIAQIDEDEGITLVQMSAQTQGRFEHDFKESDFEFIAPEEDYTAKLDISTANLPVNIGGAKVSTASHEVKTAAEKEDKVATRARKNGLEEALRLQEQLEEEERQRIARVHEEASTFNAEEWDNIQALIKVDEELAHRLQAQERERYSEANKARLLVEIINERKRKFAQQRAEQRRNKPCIKITNDLPVYLYQGIMGSHFLQQLMKLYFDGKLNQESSKRQKIGEGSEPAKESKDEMSQEQLQQLMIIVPEEGMNVEALQTKYPIINWKFT